MERIQLAEDVSLSRIVHGMWRLSDWGYSQEEVVEFIEKCLDLGVTSFDHADIYGNYTVEEQFGQALELKPSLRDKIEIVTKCGIKLISSNRPDHKIKYYDTSKEHIIRSVERSLKNFRTDYIDILLIHRPDPMMDPSEVAEAFTQLKEQGKVKRFGVSNFASSQYKLLNSYLDEPLVTNQIEISATHLEHFDKGTIEQCQMDRISPMAWSPLGGGSIFTSTDDKVNRVRNTLEKIQGEIGAESMDQVLYAWLLTHPSKILPIVGSGKIERVKSAVSSLDIKLDAQQWFEILEASKGKEVD
ncbi:aldo/keto reductase family oxidoreductase [Sutcliffiella horikoshii]|uniref:Aldo/keto reductase family oxidoreductase n=1 Tax=Sutcliffiella horikoshii TaxID=79883 RepID=A0AA94WVY5_9BACI|nr:aldo/keto reductase family oxidoreductase [Sutcliffiella horikoshii]TYS60901.1 aldo/keto reductase family oxidoreductase [Sutcliffiella horikoshii]